jgi:3-oxoacyl-[acyl-carrier-protein] synthase III
LNEVAKVIIQSIAMRTPSRRIANDWIIQRIREENRNHSEQAVSRYCGAIRRLLERAGAETRYFRDRENGERGFDLLVDAIRSAVSDAGLAQNKIDLIVYCGVGRGFLEPANAAFVAKALGMTCDSFDISEGCMSWVRSLQVAYNLLAMQAYSNILIVNAEFNVYENGLPGIFGIRSSDQIKYTFPALTIGEAATATIVCKSSRHWQFRFRSAPALASLCNLPLPGYEQFCQPDIRVGLNGAHQLVSFGSELSKTATREMVAFIRETYQDLSPIDLWFPHVASEADFRAPARSLGLNGKLRTDVFRQYGNLVSASIPAAMVLAETQGLLKRGSRIVLCPATAGMAFGLIEGEY